MCLERGQPLCPGRTCGLGVFTLALFQAVSHTACWRLALLDDNAQTLLPQASLSQVGVTPAILLTHLEGRRCEETHINFIKETEKEFVWFGGKET